MLISEEYAINYLAENKPDIEDFIIHLRIVLDSEERAYKLYSRLLRKKWIGIEDNKIHLNPWRIYEDIHHEGRINFK